MKVQVITANNGWFIKEVKPSNGNYGYGVSQYYFSGKQPEPTFSNTWFRIEPEATHVQRKILPQRFNERYELIDSKLKAVGYPPVLSVAEYNIKTDEDDLNYDKTVAALYEYKYEMSEETFEDIETEFEYIFKYEGDIIEPSISYEGAQHWSDYSHKWVNTILKHTEVQHQEIDKIMFPDLLLPECPASFSSSLMYDITRAYIKSHINPEVAEITSDYDFCFEVKKKVKKIKPEVYTYYNLFARSKKERNRLQTGVKKYDMYTIFEMTHSPKNYENYTPIPAMYADNVAELKEKVDAWLEHIISIINEPLCQCPHCEGTGYLLQEKIDVTAVNKN